MPDAWTVGHTESYKQGFLDAAANGKHLRKIGRADPGLKEPYKGGCVFRTPEAAQAFIEANSHPYSVYSLEFPTGWNEDVDESREAEEGFCRLVNTAIITGPWKE
jgi:hypothetical protein